MSYILDALRRADAERERGAVPGLQSQHHSLSGDDDEATPRSRLLLWIVLGLAALLAAALAWNLFGASLPSRQMVEGSAAPVPIAPAPITAPAAGLAPAPTSVEAAPAAVVEPAPATVPAPPIAAPPPVARTPAAAPLTAAAPPPLSAARAAALAEVEARRAARRLRDDAGAATTKAATPTTLAAPSSPAASQGEGRVYAMADIPEEVRRDIPKLAINGSSYSGDAASRMVMINGQVFHEGDRLTAGLTLEKINRKSAILVFKGWRYELTF